jgi:hypothetical protein
MKDYERAELLYDLIADRLEPVLREFKHQPHGSPNDLVMHLDPMELFEALHAARLLNIGSEHDHLRRDCVIPEAERPDPNHACAAHDDAHLGRPCPGDDWDPTATAPQPPVVGS